MEVLVHIPYWKKKEWFQDVVDGWLNQTYTDFRLLVSNDGDRDNPRKWVKADERVTFFDLRRNMGRYFADQVALQANPYELYCVSDADDIPTPDRLERLLELDTDVRLAYQKVIHRNGSATIEEPKTRFRDGINMRYIGHFAGVYRTEALRNVGGFHPGFRIGYDSLVTSLLKIGGASFDVVPKVLHTRYIRPNSLITSPDTKWRSPYREQQRIKLNKLYRTCWADRSNIKQVIEGDVDVELKTAVEKEVTRLKRLLA